MTTKHNPFKGFGVALATPFAPDGSVDVEALRKLVLTTLEGGADFLCVLGTTAETPTLNAEERELVKKTVREVVADRVPLLLGCGGNCTQSVCEALLDPTTTEGFAGVLIVAPYYNKPSQEGLYRHYAAVASSTKLPVVIYNVPGRTGVNIDPKTVVRLANDYENIVAVKEASGRTVQTQDIVREAPEGFDIISGDDGITPQLIAIGAVGVISVLGNALPREYGEMVHAALRNDFPTVRKIHEQLGQFYRLMMVDGNPAGVKSLLHLQGRIQNVLRLPLVPASEATETALREALGKLC